MTDDLSKYEELASGIPEIDDAITELVAMVRAERGHGACGWEAYQAKWLNAVEWVQRAEVAEADNAKLRKALEFYSDPPKDARPDFWDEMDFGSIARAALGKDER